MKCFLIRLWISHRLDRNEGASGAIQKHIARCPSCREFLRAGRTLGDRLKRQARIDGLPRIEHLIARTMAPIHQREVSLPTPRSRSALVAACLAAAAAVTLFWVAPGPGGGPTPVELLQRCRPPAEIGITRPLTQEMEHLCMDLDSMKKFAGAVLSALLERGEDSSRARGWQ
jgi:predicted anti-sigma-YlaC factor YlaD